MAQVALIDYGSGNLHSAARALREAAALSGTGHEITVTSDPAAILAAERIVLPGVGHFADCAAGLRAVPGVGRPKRGSRPPRQALLRHLRRHAVDGDRGP